MATEKRLIDAERLRLSINQEINRMYALRVDGVGAMSWFIDLIDQQPTIEVGKENLCRIVDGECTECGWFGDCVEVRCHNFCPGCGKKVMRDESGKDNDR